jgi:peptidoglycan/LPS O-acetylase OafA/YrhL
LLGPITDHQRFSRQGIATLLIAGNLGADRYSGDYFSPNPNPLVHTWSLSVEEQIYFFLPLVLMIFFHNPTRLKRVTALVLGFISAMSFLSFLFPAILQPLYSWAGVHLPSQFSFYSPIDRIWQFTLGGLGYLFLSQYQSHKWEISRWSNYVVVILVSVILFGPIHISLKVSSILVSLVTVFVIALRSLEILPEIVSSKLEWIGDRSYSIYLVHMPLLYIAKYSPVTQIGDGENRIVLSTIAVVASILLGALSYSKIENRYRDRGKVDRLSLKAIVLSLVSTLLVPLFILVSLDRQVAFGMKNTELPVPSEVRPWDWDKDCKIFSLRPNINREPCKYGNHNSGRSILLMGDSHAASISRAIISLGNSNDIDTFVFTFEGCGFVLNNKDFKPSFSYPYLTSDCLIHNQSVDRKSTRLNSSHTSVT